MEEKVESLRPIADKSQKLLKEVKGLGDKVECLYRKLIYFMKPTSSLANKEREEAGGEKSPIEDIFVEVTNELIGIEELIDDVNERLR